jgi:hypothetical protein
MIAAGVWLLAVASAMGGVFWYAARPGEDAPAPVSWPDGLQFARDRDKPTVVMMAHPRCSCTRASLSELAQIVTRAQGRAAFHVLFVRPEGVDDGWTDTDTYRRATALPGVRVTPDPGGVTAARLGATTSGHVVVYDRNGTLRFSGGITASRGHEGENTGRSAVLAVVNGGATNDTSTKTFGCELAERAGIEGTAGR